MKLSSADILSLLLTCVANNSMVDSFKALWYLCQCWNDVPYRLCGNPYIMSYSVTISSHFEQAFQSRRSCSRHRVFHLKAIHKLHFEHSWMFLLLAQSLHVSSGVVIWSLSAQCGPGPCVICLFVRSMYAVAGCCFLCFLHISHCRCDIRYWWSIPGCQVK